MSEKPPKTKKGSDKAGQVPVAHPAPAGFRPRYADAATCRKITEKIFKTHETLLRRLAEYERSERR